MELQQTEVKNGKEGLHINVAQMCVTAVLMALTCVATMVVQIPIPLGYAHLGDSVILISAYFLGYRTKRVDGLIPFNKRSVIIM